ncbi:class I SAM-dependent methyltransferase [Parahaliea mediterranea]|uniref:Methyltransferase domain-containing protein n=1 Tax=Parahaliea mediterranea TaxID=651086 RepID=A0A939DJM5_9GAMM|nr:class I SAM-dependent methyltransferase [Parahaliea mediterranea]MBN7799016.1 methyltransferase domain-containing protein [Parahaliea mediterranea]
MAEAESRDASSAADWDVYWRGTHEKAAHQAGGAQDAALEAFWRELFDRRLATCEQPRLLDLASGNGAVTGFAAQSCPATLLYAADASEYALRALRERFSACRCTVADALRPPFAAGSFDIVASQFGLEYAGIDALGRAAELVAPGGSLAAVLHLKGGAIDRECAVNHRAIVAIQDSRLLPLARAAFTAGFALNAGSGSVDAFKSAERAFTPAVRSLEKLLAQMGNGVAGGLARQLYDDIAHMYQRMSAYAPGDILGWVDGMTAELEAYRARMASMTAVALDEVTLRAALDQLAAEGFVVDRCDKLLMGAGAAQGAWAVVLHRIQN